MRTLSWVTIRFAAIFVLLLSIEPPVAAAADVCPFHEQADVHLEGRIDQLRVRMYLRPDDGSDLQGAGAIDGILLYPDTWTPVQETIVLNGKLTAACELRLTESGATDKTRGTWTLRLSGKRFRGTRRDRATSASAPVVLTLSKPMECDGAGGWRTFSSPKWPVVFDYPAAWKLGENESEIRLECPDPEHLAFGGSEIMFEVGTEIDTRELDDGRRARVLGYFVSVRDGEWLHGDVCAYNFDPNGSQCEPARTRTHGGMTVLEGSNLEHRVYDPGRGYAGQGGGLVEHVFFVDDAWVDVVHEDGDAVAERVVTSIRRRVP